MDSQQLQGNVNDFVYKILEHDPSNEAIIPLSREDSKDGYVHLSYESQVLNTLSKFFNDKTKLYIARLTVPSLSADTQGVLKFEKSPGGDTFPHFYGRLRKAHISKIQTITRDSEQSAWNWKP